MATALSTLIPQLLVKAPMVPQPLAIFALREAAALFCRETALIKETLPAITLVPGTAEYAMPTSTPSSTRAVKVLEAWVDDREITPITAAEIKESTSGNWTAHTGSVLHYLQEREDKILLYKIPEATGSLVVRAAIGPSLTATSVDDMLVDRYWRAIVAGALAELFETPGETFSNPERAAVQQGIFMDYVGEAKLKAAKGFGTAKKRVKAHNF